MENNFSRFKQQVDAYKSLVDSFNKSMKAGDGLIKSIESSTRVYHKIINENMKSSMKTDYNSLGNDLKEYEKFLKRYKLATRQSVDDMILEMDRLYDNAQETERMIDNFSDAMDAMEERAQQSTDSMKKGFSDLADWLQVLQLNRIADSLDQQSNNLIDSTRKLQMSTGSGHAMVKAFRDSVQQEMQILNQETGNKYNLQDMYADIAQLAESTNIARMETLKEISRPVMIATKAMNVSLDNIALLTSKMYEQGGYDALFMERTVDTIRNLSENMNTSEDKVVSTINELYNTLVAYNGGNMTKEETEKMFTGITQMVNALEDSGIDSSHYKDFIQDLIRDQSGDAALVASRVGLSRSNMLSQLAQGDWLSPLESYVEAMSSQYDIARGNGEGNHVGTYASMVGVDADTLEAMKVISQGKFQESLDTLEENSKKDTKAVNAIEDQFISLEDQAKNYMSGVLANLTDIKESLGFGFTEVMAGIGVLSSVSNILKPIISTALGGAGTSGSLLTMLGGAGASAGGLLATAGPIAAAVAAVGISAKGIYDIVQEQKDREQQDKEDTIGAVADGLEEGFKYMYKSYTTTNEDGTVSTGIRLEKVAEEDYDEQKSKQELYNYYKYMSTQHDKESSKFRWTNLIGGGRGDDWYDYVPLIGGAIQSSSDLATSFGFQDSYDDKWEYASFINSLSGDGAKMYSSYSKMINQSKDHEKTMSFFKDNFNELLKLYRSGKMTELSKEGLTNPYKQFEAYETGTNYITHDQLAFLHEGEAVVPKQYNPSAHVTELEMLRSQNSANAYREQETISTLSETVSSISKAVHTILSSLEESNSITKDHYREAKLESRVKTSNFKSNPKLSSLISILSN